MKTIIMKVILLFLLGCTYESEQPIDFNHKIHFQYFAKGDHKKANFAMHEELLGEIPEELEKGECMECHGSFDEAVEDTPRIKDCSGCHQIFLETNLRERPESRPCVGCHRKSILGHRASIPNIDVCIICHQETISDHPEESKLMVYINDGQMINWVRVNNYLTGDTHFSHERHVTNSQVECRDCHVRVEMASMSFGLKMKMKMETCMDCHEKMDADNDCLVCHY
ncbi:MAG: cytochrome c3 family protein [Nitrospiria bacterium]